MYTPFFLLDDPVPVPYPRSLACAGLGDFMVFAAGCTMPTFAGSSLPTGGIRWPGSGAVADATFVVKDSLGGLGSALVFLLKLDSFFTGRPGETSPNGPY